MSVSQSVVHLHAPNVDKGNFDPEWQICISDMTLQPHLGFYSPQSKCCAHMCAKPTRLRSKWLSLLKRFQGGQSPQKCLFTKNPLQIVTICTTSNSVLALLMQTNLTNFEQTHASPSPRLTYIVDPEKQGGGRWVSAKNLRYWGSMVYVNLLEVRGMEVSLIQNLWSLCTNVHAKKNVIFVTYNSKHDITCVYGKKQRTKHTENM